jgi:RIO kinase 2
LFTALDVFRELELHDFRVLRSIELGMRYHEYVPIEDSVRTSRLRPDEVLFRLDRLHKMNLIYRAKMARTGYVLNSSGYDSLALKAALEGNYVTSIGEKLGVGKESDVYAAMSPEGRQIAVKFHRLGRLSFRQIRRTRRYLQERRHVSWLYASRLAAEREFHALKIVFAAGVASPQPLAQNRHLLVMSMIQGDSLFVCNYLPDPNSFLQSIISNLKICYKNGIAHGDLSEYNIIVTPELKPMIIDWPQFVKRDEPGFKKTFEIDIRHILKFFLKRFKTKASIATTFEDIGLQEAVVRA